jgi:ribosomal-protein-alanine N-acetyltransferase
MREILEAAIEFVFSEVGLHRVMAGYIPSNYRSAALLARLGFEREGYARAYMQIAGRWQDHVLTSKINDLLPPHHQVVLNSPKH